MLVRPRLLDAENQARCEYYRVRHQLLTEDFEEEMVEWLEETVGIDISQQWGIPDTALNPIASGTRQLVTPGLYGRRPTAHAPDAAGEALVGPGGYFDRAGMWTRGQWVQYLAVGAGIVFRRLAVRTDPIRDEAALVDTVVLPHNVVPFVDPEDPMRLIGIWHLRVRTVRNPLTKRTECFYAWDQWHLHPDGTGSLTVAECGYDGQPKKDRSYDCLIGADGMPGPQVGPRFPALDDEGRAFLPWVVYRAVDTGEFWPIWRRSMHRGTLRACAHWTYTSRSALFATGEHVIITGIDAEAFPGVNVTRGDGDQQTALSPIHSMPVHPGTLTFAPLSVREGSTLQSISVGPGVNLPNLAEFANMYNMLLQLADGLHPTDATRQSANPTSGAALEISARSRREFSAQVTPLFRQADTELIQKAAWLLSGVGIETPADGYSIEYHTIPLSPSEQEDLRADLQWEEERGQISPIDIHLRLHPGKTAEQAKKAIIQARVDAAEIEHLVREALKAKGLDTGAEKANPFASVGLPALLEARDAEGRPIMTADEARGLLGLPGPAPAPEEKPDPPPSPFGPGGLPVPKGQEDEDTDGDDPPDEDEPQDE